MSEDQDFLEYFKQVPKTGVIFVLDEASKHGYSSDDPSWANLGQGAPETGPLSDSKLEKKLTITEENSEYSPVSGINSLRHKIADYYNHHFRQNKTSKYTYKNVCIAGGGRVALSRLVGALGNINMGHFIPDYTAYEELLTIFHNFVPIPINLKKENNYKIRIEELKQEIIDKGLSALLISNPCNPTGQVIQGDALNKWVQLSRELRCVSVFDEFYSHYIYEAPNNKLMSAAEYIEDVNKDPIVLINGLAKNWRSPGWRLGWLVANEGIIERVSSVGSYLDGGAVHPLQEEALNLLADTNIQKETVLIRKVFAEKRAYMLERLNQMGINVEVIPESTFYVWCNLSSLPSPINECMTFFRECLKEKVITVPGIFFDVNPGKRRLKKHSKYNSYLRLSFGPSMENLKVGLDSLERVVKSFM